MTMRLTVYLDDGHKNSSAAIKISGLYEEAFEPIRTNDHPLMCLMEPGSMTMSSQAFTVKRKLREDASEVLAKELAKVLIRQMEQYDYHNGYQKENQNDRV